MAYSRTLSELELAVRREADMVNSQFVTSAEVRAYINQSWAELYDRIVLFDQEYLLRYVDFASTGAGEYDIQNDLHTGVVRSISSIYAGGTGYVNGASVTLSQGANATATGIITASGGAITGVTLTNAGFGYVDAAMPSQAWQLQNSTAYISNTTFTGGCVFVGNYAYYVINDYVANTCRILKVDMLTGAHTTSSVISSDILEVLAYDTNNNKLVTIDTTTSSVVSIDPATLSFTSAAVAGSPPFVQNGVLFDPNTGDIFAASSSTIYRLDLSGTILDSLTPGYVILSILTIASASSPSVLFVQDSSDNLYSVQCSPLGPSLLVSGYPDKIVSAVYVPAVDRLYMSMGLGAPTSAQYYDFNIMSNVDIEPTLVAAGYVPGVCLLSYDVATDEVWYASFSAGPTSNVVVGINATTGAVSTSITTAAGQADCAARLGQRVIVTGYSAGMTPLNLTTYIYEYGGGTGATIPNYIVLDVSGGTGGQIVAYIESDFYKCKGVWYGSGSVGNTTTFNPLRRFMWDEQNLLRQAGIYEGSNELPYYRIYTVYGRELLSIAPDTLGGSYRVYYYPAPQKMLVDTDRVDGRSGWDEWVIKDAAIKCLLKEESVEQAAAIKVIRDELFQRFQLHASERDAAQPERIRRTALLSNRYGWWR